MTPTRLVLGALATARLARLVTQDSVFDTPRLRYVRRMDRTGHPKLAELAVCPWCVSVWIGAAVAVAGELDVPAFDVVAAALAFSQVAGTLGELGADPLG